MHTNNNLNQLKHGIPMHTVSVTNQLHSEYDDLTWEIALFPSGTVIVTTHNPNLSYFYVYGPKKDTEQETDNARYGIAKDLVKLLNDNVVPSWLTWNHVFVGNLVLEWPDGTRISCPDHTCGNAKARELHGWFIDHVNACNGVKQIMESEDKTFIEFARTAAQEQTHPVLHQLDLAGLEAFKQNISKSSIADAIAKLRKEVSADYSESYRTGYNEALDDLTEQLLGGQP